MKGLSGMTPISVSARCCLSIDTLLELCYNNRVIRRYVMKRSLSWLELLWYLPLYIISVYYHLNSVMVLVIVAVGYTVSHYHKYTSSAEYREHYKKSFLFVHTKDTYATLQISCIWGDFVFCGMLCLFLSARYHSRYLQSDSCRFAADPASVYPQSKQKNTLITVSVSSV